jgi:hypothetical protein
VEGAEVRTTKAIAGRQTRDAISSARSLAGAWEPANGWVRTIRNALAMTAGQLGRRMGSAESTITQMERKEKSGEITLKQLDRAIGSRAQELIDNPTKELWEIDNVG